MCEAELLPIHLLCPESHGDFCCQ